MSYLYVMSKELKSIQGFYAAMRIKTLAKRCVSLSLSVPLSKY